MGRLSKENNYIKIGTGLDYQHPHTKHEPYTLEVASNVKGETATGAFEVLVIKKANYAKEVLVANFRVKAPTSGSTWHVKADEDFVTPGLRQYALVAKIGAGSAFEVGNEPEIEAPNDGALQLAINDDHHDTNTGYVDVLVVVGKD